MTIECSECKALHDTCALCDGELVFRVSESDLNILRQLRDALPNVGMNGWAFGVDVLERLLATVDKQ